ncbi:MAG: M20/M25/M40 family metallo-hydrolase [Chitinophagaceae bacterium]|nr:M20/M25/M40 family metallo-hydrolase [Chitinophagaceae bacterium]
MSNYNFAANKKPYYSPMKKHFLLIPLLLQCFFVFAQKLKKADRQIVENLTGTVHYLADDKLEGRRAGTDGEKQAASYISEQFKIIEIAPKGDKGSYLQAFDIQDGKKINAGTLFMVNGKEMNTGVDYFPFPFSPNASVAETPVAISLSERGAPWFKDIEAAVEENKDNPHFDMSDYIKKEAKIASDKGASALIVYNSGTIDDGIAFDKKDKSELLSIPIIYLAKSGKDKYLKDASTIYDIRLKVDLGQNNRTGHNVVGYIDNGAPSTIIIGAHYDHLGYGEDGNGLSRSKEKQIYNGADDNASGTAALIEIARILKKSKAKKNNYALIAFSGEELGLFGSKYFTEHPTIDLASANYMINMDMVGRMNDSAKAVTIGGFGTSPTWSEVVYAQKNVPFSIKIDSSGVGPSDHTSFYRKNIPVLFFFTGLHQDYHKPSDDADKINYAGELYVVKYIQSLIEGLNKKGKLAFTPTREVQTGTTARFSVTLGIMPDYTFNGDGVRADGVSEGRPAQKAGIKTGDIITALGDYKTNSMEAYMQALSKFKKGQSTVVTVLRGKEQMKFEVTF